MTVHNIEAEQQLLGAILTNNDIYDRVAPMLRPDFFSDPVHEKIFRVIGDKVRDGKLASPVTMKAALENDEGLKILGGPGYLARLAGAAIAAFAARDYAEVVADAAALRAIDGILDAAKDKIRGGEGPRDVSLAILSGLQALPEARGAESRHSVLKAATDAVSDALKAYQGNSGNLDTGLAPLDGILRGLAPDDLCLIGGAPSMGKTSLAVEIANHVARLPEKGVVFVSLEMSKEQLANRFISRECRIPYNEIRAAEGMSEADFRKYVETAKRVGESMALEIVPKHVRTMAQIKSAVRRAAMQMPGGKPSMVVVDYAQLVKPDPDQKFFGRVDHFSNVSTSLKEMAGVIGCPVVALVQLSREIGKRPDRRPQLTDIRETGQFEQDADQVVMCHREYYWLERLGPQPGRSGKLDEESRAEWAGEMERWKGKMEIFVRKNRHGRIAGAEVGFHEPTNRFWRLGDEQEEFR